MHIVIAVEDGSITAHPREGMGVEIGCTNQKLNCIAIFTRDLIQEKSVVQVDDSVFEHPVGVTYFTGRFWRRPPD